jgi:predicted SprT family Zn-dependent metalloprotease
VKIENKTHWRTDHLRAFISRIAKEELGAEARKRLHITVVYNRAKDKGYVTGCAFLGGSRAWIKVPSGEVDKIDLAHVIAHELAHIRGMQHRQMTHNPQYSRVGDWRSRYAWALDMPLEKAQPKPKQDVQVKRYEAVLAQERRWQTKLKRAQTALKKLRPKLRRYERVLTAAGKLPDQKTKGRDK